MFENQNLTRRITGLITTFLICFSTLTQAQNSDKTKIVKYADTLEMSKSESLIGLQILDSIVPNYDVFLNGENHTYMTSNSALWVKTIKYLYTHAGVRNVMIEYGDASGWLINRYLQTGDTALFRILDRYAFKEFSAAYKELMEFNQTLPDGQKIRLVGIDLERGMYSAVKVLSLLIPTNKIPHDSIEVHVESLLGLATYQDRELFRNKNLPDTETTFSDYLDAYSTSNTLDYIIDNFEAHKAHYLELLDTNFVLFEKTIHGLEDVRRWKLMEKKNVVQDYVYREKYMYDRFEEDYLAHGGKYFGQFGRCHATKKIAEKNGCNWFQFKSFGNRINQSQTLGLQNKIFTIAVMYKADNYFEDDWTGIQPHVDSLFTHMDNNRLKLYDLRKDSFLQNQFVEDFDMIWLNTTKPNRSHPYQSIFDEFEDDEEGDDLTTIVYSYGRIHINLDGINNRFLQVAQSFTTPLTFHGFEITNAASDKSVESSQFFGFLNAQKKVISQTVDESTKVELNGFVYRSTGLYNFFSKVEWIDVMAGISLGYSQLTLTFEKSNNNASPNLIDGDLGETRISKFTNPAFTGGVTGIIDFNIGHITLGLHSGYQQDFSNPQWRAKEILKGGPRTKLTGLYYALRLGFNFK